MTGKERVLKAVRCEDVDRIPWVPFVGCHGGKLINAPASDYLQSKDLLVAGLNEAIRLYNPTNIGRWCELV